MKRIVFLRCLLIPLLLSAGTLAACSDTTVEEEPYEEYPDFDFEDEDWDEDDLYDDLESESAPEVDEVVSARFEPGPGAVLIEGIILEEASAWKGDLTEEAFSPQTGQRYAKGRRCLVVSIRLHNTTTETRSVDMWVDGYNSKGERESSTLISETQPGYLHVDMPAGADQWSQVILNWGYYLSILQFSVAGDDVAVPATYTWGQMLDIDIEPAPESFIAEGIVLEKASPCVGALKHGAYRVQPHDSWSRGEWCVLVSGRIRNTTNQDHDVDMWVDGYNAYGDIVASTLALETQQGYLHINLPGEASRDFEISVSWSDEIRTLEFTADIDDRMIPAAPVLPSSHLPAGLIVYPAVGEYLTTSAKGESSQLLLLAIEVEQTASPERYWSHVDDSYTVEQGEPVLVISGVLQNRHRTYHEISMNAHGSDAAGEQVSFTLDSAHLPGCIGLEIPPGETGEFTLHMNPSDDLTSIRIFGALSPIPFP